MTLERRSPLPPGRYWLDLYLASAVPWGAYIAQPGVRVVVSESYPNEVPPRLFTIWQTDRPTDYPATELGAPNIATPDINTSADTVQRPEPEEPVDVKLERAGQTALYLGVGIVALLAISAAASLARTVRGVRA